MSIAKFSVRNPVFVNLVMAGLICFGAICLFNMPQELNPQIDFNWVLIAIPYPGASPEEVESLIVDPIEAEIHDLDKIDELNSQAGEGLATVLVKFEDMAESEFREIYTDLKGRIDRVALPEEAEDPVVDDFDSGDFLPILTVNMAFTIPEENAQIVADDLEEDLKNISGVAKVQVAGLPEREIWVEVDPSMLAARGLTILDVVRAMKARNLNVPGGVLTHGAREYAIRSLSEFRNVEEIRETIIRAAPGGDAVRIGDVARVRDRREEPEVLSRLNGNPSITFSLSKKTDANTNDVIRAVKETVGQYEGRVPDGISFSYTDDNSVYINRVINALRNNAITGMILISLVLWLFLGSWNAFLATLGIPISFFITFILLSVFGYTINGSTLFAMVMVLGIIVDDAIIVIENCHRYRLQGRSAGESAILGTGEVTTPILSSVGTNIAAFLPLILLPGVMGKFMRVIPLTFALALAASVVEAFVLLPSHYAEWTRRSNAHKRGEQPFFKRLRRIYGRLLIRTLRRRYWVIGCLVVVLIGAVMLIPFLGVDFYSDEEFDAFKVLIKFPEGTSLYESDRVTRAYEAEARRLSDEDIEAVVTNVGLLQSNNEWLTRKSVSQVLVQLKPREERVRMSDDLIAMLRERTEHIAGATSVNFEKFTGGPPVGKPISVKVQGRYLERLKEAALVLQDSLGRIPGALEVTDDFPPGKDAIRIEVDEVRAALYGFSPQEVALNVRYAFDGVEATKFRDGDEEVGVIVQYDQAKRSTVDDVLNVQVTNAGGSTVALRDMVSFSIGPGHMEINRFDRKRTIMVTGEIDEETTTVDQINDRLLEIFPSIEARYSGVSFEIGGEFTDFMEAFEDIASLFAISLILMFVILGTQFNSYAQPLVILTAVPFAIIGASLGLLISGNPFSLISLFGFVALAGIVVNDAIVMVAFINRRRQAGGSVTNIWRSIVNAGRLRLRPIILTSVTTISGLMPMAVGIGGKSALWSPLANVILFGLLVSTVLTLFVIPCFMAVLDDIKRERKKARQASMRRVGSGRLSPGT